MTRPRPKRRNETHLYEARVAEDAVLEVRPVVVAAVVAVAAEWAEVAIVADAKVHTRLAIF